jgi:hypothetical protein
MMGRGTLESGSLVIPAEHAFAITPQDGVNLPVPTRGVYVGTGGDLRVRMVDGGDVMFINLAAGIIHPLCIIQVWATGTTADDIRGLG